MNLDKISIDIRPRNSWRAFDLGCVMAMKWWKPLMGFWLIATAPLFLLACFISPEFGPLLIWLCKPLFERGLLYIYSRRVFGEEVSAKQALINWPKQLKKMWFSSITWRRLSPSRGFDLAVVQLEGLTGEARSKRLTVLHKTTDDNSGWWLFICLHWEVFFLIGLLTTINLIIPQGIDINVMTVFRQPEPWMLWLYNACLFTVWLIVAPIFIGGSFASYLNRRIILEGWDIELNFKKIIIPKSGNEERSNKASVLSLSVIFISILLLNAPSNSAYANETQLVPEVNQSEIVADAKLEIETESEQPEFESKKRIRDILDVPPFNENQTVKKYRWKGWNWEAETSEEQSTIPEWVEVLVRFIATFGEILLWLVFAAILFLLVYLTKDHILYFLRSASEKVDNPTIDLPSFSKVYEEEGLPSDLGAEVEQLLASESYRKLLSLLLVTSLIEISKEQRLPLTNSMTEQECLRVIKASIVDHRKEFMQTLIDTWIKLAWAHIWPSNSKMKLLSEEWKDLFELHLSETGEA